MTCFNITALVFRGGTEHIRPGNDGEREGRTGEGGQKRIRKVVVNRKGQKRGDREDRRG